MVDLFRYQHWDLVSKRWLYYTLSALILLVGVVALINNKMKTGEALNYGIDFKGGGLITYTVDGRLPENTHAKIIGDIRTTLQQENLDSEVQVSPSSATENPKDQIIVRTKLKEGIDDAGQDAWLAKQINTNINAAVQQAVKTNAPELTPPAAPEGQEVVTGTVSSELVNNSIGALIIGSLLILGWIWLRYNIAGFGFRYAAGGILALVHDLITLIGMFALLHNFLQVNSPFIAALLTVLGYSIHDTIIIYDRIRENIKLRKGRTFAETVNISLLETMARSVNTILTVLFTLLALIFFGGPTLRDFTAAMLIGIVIGGYSSIFVASQLLVSWSKPEEKVLPKWSPEQTPVATELAPGIVTPVTTAAPVTVTAGSASTPVVSTADRDAVQRARTAGKTSKRKR